MKFFAKIVIFPYLFVSLLTVSAQAGELEWKFGIDHFTKSQTPVSGLHQLTLGYVTDQGYFLGQSLYSGALGQGGGLFVGGVEAGRYFDLGHDYRMALGAYVGGGGGGSRVHGDGIMVRPFLTLEIPTFGGHLGLGASWTTIDGSDIATPAITTYYSKPFNLNFSVPNNGGTWKSRNGDTVFKSASLRYMQYLHSDSSKTISGAQSQDMHLLGGEFVFDSNAAFDTFLQANGVVSGFAEGYADWVLGVRSKNILGNTIFAYEFGLGAGCGGAIDTGGGLLWTAGLSANITLSDNWILKAGISRRKSFNGAFSVVAPSLDIAYNFGSSQRRQKTQNAHKIQFYSGITRQFPNTRFIRGKPHYSQTPNLLETTIDVFLNEKFYITGQASTAFTGDVGGYQLGLFGIGWHSVPKNNWSYSAEVVMGAAGGAGVDTNGGLIYGARAEIDYWIDPSLALTVGLGHVRAAVGQGMAPTTVNVGLKVPTKF